MKWTDTEKDILGTRFYGEFNESSDDLSDLFNFIVEELNKLSLSENADTFNIHIPVEAGLIYFYPCNRNSLYEEVKVQFCVQFYELMETYDSACNSKLSDSAFDLEVNRLLKIYVSRIDECVPKDKIPFRIVYTDVDFNERS